MKNEIRLALFFMAATAMPSFAQNASPDCGTTNYDQSRNLYTIVNAPADAVNQQCFVTVYSRNDMPSQVQQYPASYLVEGRYAIEMSGGGGGGGGGAEKDMGGGGGGAGAAPYKTVKYLSPGVYKMTIGTGGRGGNANGGRTDAGNPTSLTNANTGALIAGFQGADTWTQRSQAPNGGLGGVASAGGSSGGDGGDKNSNTGVKSEAAAQSGGMLQTSGYSGTPGQSGSETGRSDDGTVQANAGGGGGASVGSGGAGESAGRNTAAGMGDLGGGGGGGRGGKNIADAGGRGGNGFIKLALESGSQPVARAPAPAVAEQAPAAAAQGASAPDSDRRVSARPAKKDRN